MIHTDKCRRLLAELFVVLYDSYVLKYTFVLVLWSQFDAVVDLIANSESMLDLKVERNPFFAAKMSCAHD